MFSYKDLLSIELSCILYYAAIYANTHSISEILKEWLYVVNHLLNPTRRVLLKTRQRHMNVEKFNNRMGSLVVIEGGT